MSDQPAPVVPDDGFTPFTTNNRKRNLRRNKKKNIVFKEKTVDDYVDEILRYKDELAGSDLFRKYILASKTLDLTGANYYQLVCIGLGSPSGVHVDASPIGPCYQLALTLLLAEHAVIPTDHIYLWEPLFGETDMIIFEKLGINAVKDEACPLKADANPLLRSNHTLFFLPHSPRPVLDDYIHVCETTEGSCILGNDINDITLHTIADALKEYRYLYTAIAKGSWTVESLPTLLYDENVESTNYAFSSLAIQRPIA